MIFPQNAPPNCLTLNHTEARKREGGLRNRCLKFDDTEPKLGINEHEQSKRVRGKDAGALWPGPRPQVQDAVNRGGGGAVRLRAQARHQAAACAGLTAPFDASRAGAALRAGSGGGAGAALAGERRALRQAAPSGAGELAAALRAGIWSPE